jgi:alanine or glycine:cation symporter, AGCS family
MCEYTPQATDRGLPAWTLEMSMEQLMKLLDTVNGVIWHPIVLYIVLGVGVLFTIWSGIGQFRSITHGTKVIRGAYDDKDDPGAINHFQALSAALSATVGLGNIAGVAVAVALGGPGAVFWMWMVGVFGMALKMTEVTLSMLYRNTDNPDEPHGGPMYVASKAFKERGMGGLGKLIGGIFVVTLLISTITGGNMFQAWAVSDVTSTNFGVPVQVTGIILTVVVALVILGGIKRIGAVAGRIVPFMCLMYLLGTFWVLAMTFDQIPGTIALIFKSAFSPAEAQGAFIGGTFGFALLWGMKRALFSSEAGQGSSPIAHSAAKTDEPVREGIVAGLEPFIDTIVVCTLTSLVILSSGAWNRGEEASYKNVGINVIASPESTADDMVWTLDNVYLPDRSSEAKRIEDDWNTGSEFQVFMLLEVDTVDKQTGTTIKRLNGAVHFEPDMGDSGTFVVAWETLSNPTAPRIIDHGVYVEYPGASLTSHAFNMVTPGMGKYLVVFAAWLFAISTMISWSYYGEQGVVYLFGESAILPYKVVYCLMILVASAGFIKTDAQLDNITALGTGVMLWANIPIMLIFGSVAMRAYHDYIGRLKRGELDSHEPASLTDVMEGKDVE